MKNQISLKKFIETFPLESFCRVSGQIPDNFKELSYEEKYKLLYTFPMSNTREVLSVEDGHIYYGKYTYGLERKGKNIYCSKAKLSGSIWIESNSIRIGDRDKFGMVSSFLAFINKSTLFRDVPTNVMNMYFAKPSVFRAVLTNRIYNEETLYKFIGKRVLGLKDVGWRTVKTYCTHSFGVSIFDLRDFTKNVSDSIEVLSKTQDLSLYTDLVRSAIKLNQVVDLTWSLKRIEEEHQKQTELLMRNEIASKEKVPIYEHVFGNKDIKMLNTEVDVFMEGFRMHHCLYTCYYNSIKDHNFIAFHMTYPEDCTFSVRFDRNSNRMHFDQIQCKYNKPVLAFTLKYVQDFINEHEEDFLKCFDEKPMTRPHVVADTTFIDALVALPY